ncbi:hypothetical protein CVT26_013505 [Gymnopilus dilepis]|uniref:Uncharacterized protein n=1 Tax=Gymnopilus dilepis TaxID=231916 RepID=A0A409Y5I8_9AGAR|nr:hypothetical protein CVT26_013505 [Gymnopilus dilepis]
MGYYAEVGVGQPKDVKKAIVWYERAKSHGNTDALTRLAALSQPDAQTLSRHEHDSITQAKLVRRRTQAAQRAETQPLSPPWEGRTFPSASEWESRQGGLGGLGQGGLGQGQGQGAQGRGGQQGQGAAQGQGQGQGQRRRQDGRMVVDVIRKNSMAAGYTPPSTTTNGPAPSSAPAGPSNNSNVAPLNPRQRRDQSPSRQASQPVRTQSPGSSNRRTESPNRSGRVTPQGPQGGREPSPARGGRLPIGGGAGSGSNSSTSLTQQQGTPPSSTGGRSKLERMRLNLDDNATSFAPSPPSGAGGATPGRGVGTPSTARPLPPTGAETPNLGTLDTPRPGGVPSSSSASTSSLGGGGGGVGAGAGGVGAGGTGGVGGGANSNSNSNHKRPQTFAEMGIHGAKVDDKECVVI